MANFTLNNTVEQFAGYIGEGSLNIFGGPTMVGLILVTVFLVFCYYTKIPVDGAAFIMFFLIIVLTLSGLLPTSVMFIGLIVSGVVLAFAVLKMIR